MEDTLWPLHKQPLYGYYLSILSCSHGYLLSVEQHGRADFWVIPAGLTENGNF